MLAAVHSALGIADALVLSWVGASLRRERRFVASGHRLLIGRFRLLTRLYSAMGGVPGTRETLDALLRAGTSVVAFPGGVHDVTRPVWRWAEPDWAGRAGFVRVAASVGVPVVPLVIHGAGRTYWVLGVLRFPAPVRRWLGEPLAGVALTPTVLAAAAVTALAAAGTVSWGWVALAWLAAALPLPVRLTVEALEPVDPGSGRPEEVAEHVRKAIETALRRGAPG